MRNLKIMASALKTLPTQPSPEKNRIGTALSALVCAAFAMYSIAIAQVGEPAPPIENTPAEKAALEGTPDASGAGLSAISVRSGPGIGVRASRSTSKLKTRARKLRQEIADLRGSIGRTERTLQKRLDVVSSNNGEIFRLNRQVRKSTEEMKKVRRKFNSLPWRERRKSWRVRRFDKDIDRLRNRVRDLENKIESLSKNSTSARTQYRRAYASKAGELKSKRKRIRSKLKEAAKLEQQILNSIPNPRKRFGSRWVEPPVNNRFAALQAALGAFGRRKATPGAGPVDASAGALAITEPGSAQVNLRPGPNAPAERSSGFTLLIPDPRPPATNPEVSLPLRQVLPSRRGSVVDVSTYPATFPSSDAKRRIRGSTNFTLNFLATTCRKRGRLLWIFVNRAPCAIPEWKNEAGAYVTDHAYSVEFDLDPQITVVKQENVIPHRAAFFGTMVASNDHVERRFPQQFEHDLENNNRLAVSYGINAVEVDLKVFTKDGHLLVNHDLGADRMKPAPGSPFFERPISYYTQMGTRPAGWSPGQFERYSNLTLAEIRRRKNKVLLPVKAPQGYMYNQNVLLEPTDTSNVHTLREWIVNYINRFDLTLNADLQKAAVPMAVLDIKNSAAMEEAVKLVREYDMQNHVVFKLPVDVLLRKDLYPDLALNKFGKDLWYIIAINGSESNDGGRYVQECGDRFCLRWGNKFKDVHVWADDLHEYSVAEQEPVEPLLPFGGAFFGALDALFHIIEFRVKTIAFFIYHSTPHEHVVGFELTPDLSQKLGTPGRARIERTFERVFEHMYYWKDMGSTFSYFTTPEYGYTNSVSPGFNINECQLGAASGENALFQKPLAEFHSERDFANRAMYVIANVMLVVSEREGGFRHKVSTDLEDFARYYCDKG